MDVEGGSASVAVDVLDGVALLESEVTVAPNAGIVGCALMTAVNAGKFVIGAVGLTQPSAVGSSSCTAYRVSLSSALPNMTVRTEPVVDPVESCMRVSESVIAQGWVVHGGQVEGMLVH